MRDLETIDSKLRLLDAIRCMVCELEGRTPTTTRIDELLDERTANIRLRGAGLRMAGERDCEL